jgi:hypothetical protein
MPGLEMRRTWNPHARDPAVMDMIGCARAALIGYSEGGPTATLFDPARRPPPRASDGVRPTPGPAVR